MSYTSLADALKAQQNQNTGNSNNGGGGTSSSNNNQSEEPDNWEAPENYNPGPSEGEYARPSMGDGGDGGDIISSGEATMP